MGSAEPGDGPVKENLGGSGGGGSGHLGSVSNGMGRRMGAYGQGGLNGHRLGRGEGEGVSRL